jgi:ribosome maturation factor RimP
MTIVSEFQNDKVSVRKMEDNSLSLIIKRPSDMTVERFMSLSARLEKILDKFDANIKLLKE